MFRKRHPPVGAMPGTLAMPQDAAPPVIHIMDYGPTHVEEQSGVAPEALPALLTRDSVTWVDVRGLGDERTLRAIGEALGMHALALEDVVNVPQRPKTEAYEGHLFLVVRMPEAEVRTFATEQVSLVLGPRFVVTFQEREGDVFEPVRARIRTGRGPIRRAGADYLGYALVDTVVDAYYPVLERVGDLVEALEEEVITAPTRPTLRRIYALKRTVQELRRTVWPHRDALAALLRDESPYLGASVRVYLRDTHDHAMQLLDVLENYRDTATGLLDVYLSSESNRTNEVMRLLTVVASIFIPLTFLAGVYGMNFEAMPELHSRIGYPVVLATMLLTALGMLAWFRRRGWLGTPEEPAAGPAHEVLEAYLPADERR